MREIQLERKHDRATADNCKDLHENVFAVSVKCFWYAPGPDKG